MSLTHTLIWILIRIMSKNLLTAKTRPLNWQHHFETFLFQPIFYLVPTTNVWSYYVELWWQMTWDLNLKTFQDWLFTTLLGTDTPRNIWESHKLQLQQSKTRILKRKLKYILYWTLNWQYSNHFLVSTLNHRCHHYL